MRLLAVLVLLALPVLAHAQTRQWIRIGPNHHYAGRAVEDQGGSRVLLFGPTGAFAGRWQRQPDGAWLGFGPRGGYRGEVRPMMGGQATNGGVSH